MVKITVTGLDRVVASSATSTRLRTAHLGLVGVAAPLPGGREPEALRSYEPEALSAAARQPFVIPALEHLVPVG